MSLGGDDGYGGDYGQDPTRTGGMSPRGHLTRTRLPEGDDDPFAPPRRGTTRPGKPSRNLVTVVGVVVLLIAAIAFANRGGGENSSDNSTESDSGTSPKSQSTAPTGERPVEGKDQATGIASGFAKTEQGAQSAAANYAVALGSADMFKTTSRRQIVNAIYAPDAATARLNRLDKAFSGNKILSNAGLDAKGNPPDGMTFVSRTNPVGTKVEEFKGDTARIAVWQSLLFGIAGEGSTNPVSESWHTDTLELQWIKGDWKVTKYTQKDGPAPVGRDQAAASAEDMANAVEGFGGFTYAR
ncbi:MULTISPECIES: hypothetical protein [unclassified Streptomyces]|uniref:hypothetical protein n=1 Tax=unclassified Streptomyces TaxID=2593676 RepID=UPI00336AC75E